MKHKNSKREIEVGIRVWACAGRFNGRLCIVVSLKGEFALVQTVRTGARDWIHKNNLDTETEIQ